MTTRKQYIVVEDGETKADQYLGEVVLVNEDGSPWTPGTSDAGPIAIADVTGLEDRLAAVESRLDDLEGADS